jgi:hypothetical protein
MSTSTRTWLYRVAAADPLHLTAAAAADPESNFLHQHRPHLSPSVLPQSSCPPCVLCLHVPPTGAPPPSTLQQQPSRSP